MHGAIGMKVKPIISSLDPERVFYKFFMYVYVSIEWPLCYSTDLIRPPFRTGPPAVRTGKYPAVRTDKYF